MSKAVESIRLDYDDIVNITENISRELEETLKQPITQGYMEYLFCKALKKIKDVNMYIAK